MSRVRTRGTTRTAWQKSAPVTKALRTFGGLMAGTLTTVMAIMAGTDWSGLLPTLILGTTAAVVGGIAAGLLAFKVTIESPWARAFASFAQYVGAGLVAAPVLDSIDPTRVYNYGHSIGRLVLAGIVAAIIALTTNASEDAGV